MRRLLFSLLALLPAALADVEFTYPAAGASIPAGPITVKWSDSGIPPSLSQLKSYTLQLMVGGNDPTTAMPLVSLDAGPGSFATGNSATGTISPTIAEVLKNGFYLQMISTSKNGGTVTNFSPRFTLSGMTGVTAAKYVQQVQALGGSTTGPPTINAVAAAPAAPVPAAPAAPVDPNAAGFGIPYNLQQGLTKYASMQPVPPTKITKQKATPLFPTSAFTIARGQLPPPSILTTLTASQTFSVHTCGSEQSKGRHGKVLGKMEGKEGDA